MTEHIEHIQQPGEASEIDEALDLTNIRILRHLLLAHGMRPNKSFGQNFLIDRAVLSKIVEAAELSPQDDVLEVGAGTGVLTRELARDAKQVIAVELERDMLTLLRKTTSHLQNVTLIERNLLAFNPGDSFGLAPYKMVANLPYYLTAAALRHFLEHEHAPSALVVMVQWEVAQRIVADPGDLSLFAISVQLYGKPRIIARVPAQAFYPAPKVDSAILRIDVYKELPLLFDERARFFRVVQAGFSEARKQLHNSLTHGLHYKNTQVREWLALANIEANRRAETLTLDEWLRLWRVVETYS